LYDIQLVILSQFKIELKSIVYCAKLWETRMCCSWGWDVSLSLSLCVCVCASVGMWDCFKIGVEIIFTHKLQVHFTNYKEMALNW